MMTEDQPKMFASSRPPEPVAEELERSYLAAPDRFGGSGFRGGAARWRANREVILDAVDHAGSFLDVGCANGLLLESIIAWGETLTMVAWVDRE